MISVAKKIILTFSILMIWALPAIAANKTIPCKDLNYDFYAIHFVNANNGWIGGISGLLFRTSDGGLTWQRLKTGTYNSIFGVSFVNKNKGFLIGQRGLAMRTDDGGLTWEKMTIPEDKTLLTLHFYNDQIGMAAGDWGKIISTHDGGKTWQNVSLKEDVIIYDLKYISPNDVWLAGEMGNIFHTVNGGKTWEKKKVAEGTLFGIDFDNHGNGLAVGIDGIVLRTRDGGKNWKESHVGKQSLYAVRINGNTALAVGDVGTIYIMDLTAQDGVWRQIQVPLSLKANWLQCIGVLNAHTFIIGGANGSIHFIRNGEFVSNP